MSAPLGRRWAVTPARQLAACGARRRSGSASIAALWASLVLPAVAGSTPPARPVAGAAAATAAEGPDWRGLRRLDERGNSVGGKRKTAVDFERLVANAPYRVQVATSGATAIRIVDVFTLERSRVYSGAPVHGFAFGGDGEVLYAVVGEAPALQVLAITVATGKQERLGALTLGADERVAHVEGGAGGPGLAVTVGILRGAAGGCAPAAAWRRLRLRRRPGAAVAVDAPPGPPLPSSMLRKAAISPNTRWRAALEGGLTLQGRFGNAGVQRIDGGAPVPKGADGLAWMRDSRGLLVATARPGCRGADVVVYRAADDKAGWQSSAMPADVALSAEGLDPLGFRWAPDGMRLVGMRAGRVVLFEPAPRYRGTVAVIAEESTLPPQLRPGVRSLASGAGALRHAELLLEQGDVDAAAAQLALDGGAAPAAERARLEARLQKLRALMERRAVELGLPGCALRSTGCATSPHAPAADGTAAAAGAAKEGAAPGQAAPAAAAEPSRNGEADEPPEQAPSVDRRGEGE